MKRVKWGILGLAVFALLLTGGTACKKKGGAADTGKLIALLPSGAQVVMGFDFHRFAQLPVYDKITAEKPDHPAGDKLFDDPEEFRQKTGIDLKKDVNTFVVGMYGLPDRNSPDWAAVASVNYDPAKVEKTLAEKKENLTTETYGGKTVYLIKEKAQPADALGQVKPPEEVAMVLLNPATIVLASPARIHAVIDLAQGKGSSMAADATLKKHLAGVKQDGLFWLVMGQLPDSMKKKPAAGGMFSPDLSRAEALVGSVDFQNATLSGEFRLICPDENANKQLESMLNGLKGMGAMLSAKEPDLGELLNKITITASAADLKLTFALPEALLNRLGEKAKNKASSIMTTAPAAPAETVAETPAN